MAEIPLARPLLLSRQLLSRRPLTVVSRSFSLVGSVNRRHRPMVAVRPRLALVQRSLALPRAPSSQLQSNWRQSPMVWLGQPDSGGQSVEELPIPVPVRIPTSEAVETRPGVARRAAVTPAPPAQFSPRPRPRVAAPPATPPAPTAEAPSPADVPQQESSGLVRGSDLWQRLFPERPSFLQGVRDKEVARKKRVTKRPPPVVPTNLPRTRTWEITPGDPARPTLPVAPSPAADQTIAPKADETAPPSELEEESKGPPRAGPPEPAAPTVQRDATGARSTVPRARDAKPDKVDKRIQKALDDVIQALDARPAAPGAEGAAVGAADEDGGASLRQPAGMDRGPESGGAVPVQSTPSQTPAVREPTAADPHAQAEHPDQGAEPMPAEKGTQDHGPILDSPPSSPVDRVSWKEGQSPAGARPSAPRVPLSIGPAATHFPQPAGAGQEGMVVAEGSEASSTIQATPERATRPSREEAPGQPADRSAGVPDVQAAPEQLTLPSREEAPDMPVDSPVGVPDIQAAPRAHEPAQPSRRQEDLAIGTPAGEPLEGAQTLPTGPVGPPGPPTAAPVEDSRLRAAVQPPIQAHRLAPEAPRERQDRPASPSVERSVSEPAEAMPTIQATRGETDARPPSQPRTTSQEAGAPAQAEPAASRPLPESQVETLPSRASAGPDPVAARGDRQEQTLPSDRGPELEPAGPVAAPPSLIHREVEPAVPRIHAESVEPAGPQQQEPLAERATDRQRVRAELAPMAQAPPETEGATPRVQAKRTDGGKPTVAPGDNGTVRVQARAESFGDRPPAESEPAGQSLMHPLPLRTTAGATRIGRRPDVEQGSQPLSSSPAGVARRAVGDVQALRPAAAPTVPLPFHVPAAVQRLETARPSTTSATRALPERQSSTAPEEVEAESPQELDTDQLAREVYEVLKRRLLTEREQFWGF